jgi:hypothetical protein
MLTVQPQRLFRFVVLCTLLLYSGKMTAQTNWSVLTQQDKQTYIIGFSLAPASTSGQMSFSHFRIMQYDTARQAFFDVYEDKKTYTSPKRDKLTFKNEGISNSDYAKLYSIDINLPVQERKLTCVLNMYDFGVFNQELNFSAQDMTALAADEIDYRKKHPDTVTNNAIDDGQENKTDAMSAETETNTDTKTFEWQETRLPQHFWILYLPELLLLLVLLTFVRRFQYRIFHDRNRTTSPDTHPIAVLPYPIIRRTSITGWKKKKRLLLLSPEGLTFAAIPEDASFATLYTTSWDDQWKEARSLRRKQSFSYSSIQSLSHSENHLTGDVHYLLQTPEKKLRFLVPAKQSGLCSQAFAAALGDRYREVPFRTYSKDIAALVLIFVFGCLVALAEGSSKDPSQPLFHVYILIISLGSIIGTIYTWLKLRFYEQWMVKRVKLPYINITRLRWLGITLKIVLAATMLCWFIGYLQDMLTVLGTQLVTFPEWMLAPYEILHFNDGILTLVILGNLACFAYFLLPASPAATNKPLSILYLHTSSDYDAHSLNGKGGRWAKWTGIQNPFPSLKKKEPGSLAHILELLSIRYIYNFHPIRIIRILLGKPQDTTREQLVAYASTLGQVHTPVPAYEYFFRSHVSDGFDHWLSDLNANMTSHTHAILQPYYREAGYGTGMEQVIGQLPPSRILFCLLHFQNNPEEFERFRMQLMQWMPGCQVPKHLGQSSSIYFLSFDEQGQPRLFPVKQYKGLKSFFRNTNVDLRSSIQSFFQ